MLSIAVLLRVPVQGQIYMAQIRGAHAGNCQNMSAIATRCATARPWRLDHKRQHPHQHHLRVGLGGTGQALSGSMSIAWRARARPCSQRWVGRGRATCKNNVPRQRWPARPRGCSSGAHRARRSAHARAKRQATPVLAVTGRAQRLPCLGKAEGADVPTSSSAPGPASSCAAGCIIAMQPL